MLGVLRFILALLVLVSHSPGNNLSLNFGVTAVIIFYFISGFLMHHSYCRFRKNSHHPIASFYVDRVLKLFPQYLIVVVLSFSIIYWMGPAEQVMFMNQSPSPLKVALNLSLLPTNYIFPPFEVTALLPHPIVPPAWSLSTEFHFYLLLPVLALLPRKGLLIALACTATIQISSLFFASGPFNSNTFGYRYIFGVLTFFMFGYAYAQWQDPFFRKVCQCLWIIYAALLIIIAPAAELYANPKVQELLLGAVLAWPLLKMAMSTSADSKRLKHIDNILGRLAYPIFVSHFLAFLLCEKLFQITYQQPAIYYPAAIAMCLLISIGLMGLQQQIEKYRIQRRGFSSISAPFVPPMQSTTNPEADSAPSSAASADRNLPLSG